MKVYLSPAQHANPGACSPGGVPYREDYWCRKVANEAAKILRAAGVTVKVSTNWPYDNFVGAATQSNAWGADVHIPIHSNAGNGRMRGTDTFYYSTRGKALAQTLLRYIGAVSGQKRSVTYKTWHELTATNAIAAYVELDFHDNPAGCKHISTNYRLFGKAIAEGVLDHYNVSKPKPKSTIPLAARSLRKAFLSLPDRWQLWVLKYAPRWHDKGK